MKTPLQFLDTALGLLAGFGLLLCLGLAVAPALLILVRLPDAPLVFAVLVLGCSMRVWLRRAR
jgi:hypothetical protein